MSRYRSEACLAFWLSGLQRRVRIEHSQLNSHVLFDLSRVMHVASICGQENTNFNNCTLIHYRSSNSTISVIFTA